MTRVKGLGTLLLIAALWTGCERNPFVRVWRGETAGYVDADMNARLLVLSRGEAELGNLVTDAMLESARRVRPEVQLALINSGAIRYEQVKLRNGIYPAGEIFTEMFETMIPFDNRIVTVEVDGARLRSILERGASGYPKIVGQFLQVSRGSRLHIDAAGSSQTLDRSSSAVVEPGDRVKSFAIDGRELDDQAFYSVATIDFLAAGNEGFLGLAGRPARDVEPLRHAIARYVRVHSPVQPRVEGRIVVND